MKHTTKTPRFNIVDIPFFDKSPYYSGYVEEMKKIVKENGGSNIRMRNKYDAVNLPQVITFSVKSPESVDKIKSKLESEISEWCRVEDCANWNDKSSL